MAGVSVVNTVRGKISPDDLKKVYMHEHVYADLSNVRPDEDSVLTNTNEIIEELKNATHKDIHTFVDVSCIGMGRDVLKLKEISTALDAHVVCSTGFYLTSYYPEYVFTESYKELADRFISEITVGIDGTDICAGIIGEIATGKNEFTEENKKVFKAAAYAHRKTGVAITTHASAGTMAKEQAEFLINESVAKEKIVIGHMDLMDDLGYVMEVLDLGVNIGFDTIGKNVYVDNAVRVKNFAELIKKGYSKQIILSEDISRKSYYLSKGGHGYAYLVDVFIPLALQAGVTEEDLNTVLVENPKRILNIDENIINRNKASERIQVLVDYESIVPVAVPLGNGYMDYINERNTIDTTHQNYDMFETHLMMATSRIAKGEAFEEFPQELNEEISGKWFESLSIEALKHSCGKENFIFTEAEAKFLAIHLAVLLKGEES